MADEDDDLFESSGPKHNFDGQVCKICGIVHDIEVEGDDLDDSEKDQVRSLAAEVLTAEVSGNERIGRVIVGRMEDPSHRHGSSTSFASGLEKSIRRTYSEASQAAAFMAIGECLDSLTGGDFSRRYDNHRREMDLLFTNYMQKLIGVILDVFAWDIQKGTHNDFAEAHESDQAQLLQYLYTTSASLTKNQDQARERYLQACVEADVKPLSSLVEADIFNREEDLLGRVSPATQALMGEIRTNLLDYLGIVSNALELRNEIAEKKNGSSPD